MKLVPGVCHAGLAVVVLDEIVFCRGVQLRRLASQQLGQTVKVSGKLSEVECSMVSESMA